MTIIFTVVQLCALQCCESKFGLVRLWAVIPSDCMRGRLTGIFTVVQLFALLCSVS
jgi:hypothetical protein